MLMSFIRAEVGNIEKGNTKLSAAADNNEHCDIKVGNVAFNPSVEIAGLLPTTGLQNGEAFKKVMQACCDLSTNPHKQEIYGPDAAKALAGNAFPAANVDAISGPRSIAAISHKPGGLSV